MDPPGRRAVRTRASATSSARWRSSDERDRAGRLRAVAPRRRRRPAPGEQLLASGAAAWPPSAGVRLVPLLGRRRSRHRHRASSGSTDEPTRTSARPARRGRREPAADPRRATSGRTATTSTRPTSAEAARAALDRRPRARRRPARHQPARATPAGTCSAAERLAARRLAARRRRQRHGRQPASACAEFGVAGYLPKPFPLETLVATIERLLTRRKRPNDMTDLQIAPDRRRLRRWSFCGLPRPVRPGAPMNLLELLTGVAVACSCFVYLPGPLLRPEDF